MIDFSQLEALFVRVEEACELAIPVAIDAERGQILRRTSEGKDADNREFPKWRNYHRSKKVQPWTYSPPQSKRRAAKGLETSKKDIRESGDTLDSLSRQNENELATDDTHMPIMVGQMQHPKWLYHHNVLGVNHEDIPVMQEAIHKMLEAHI